MSTIEVSRAISAPADVVWSAVTSLDDSPERISGIVSIERLGGPEFGVGTRWRETRKMFGREATEEMEVTAIDQGRSYGVEADGHGAHYTSVISVIDEGPEASTLAMSFGAEPQGLLPKLMVATVGRLFQGATKKALQQDLDDIAAAVERSGD